MTQPAPLKTFIIYARSDEAYKQQLLLHLRPLLTSRLLSVWHDGNILPGEDWEKAIKKELNSSDLVLVLVSAHSLNSEFIQTQELRTALDRLSEGLTRVVPVIVSPCGWKFDPVLAGLQALPLYGGEGPKPVNDRVWQSTDEAWASVIDHLGDMMLEIQKQREAEERAEEERLRSVQEREVQQVATAEAARREAADYLARAKREREAADLAKQREDEQQRLEKDRLEKEQQAAAEREAARQRVEQERHAATWTAASKQRSIVALEQFLADYPDSGYAREARHRIKTLRQSERKPMAWGKWAGIGAVVLAVAFLGWKLTQWIPDPPPEVFIEKIGSIDYPMVRVAGGIYTMGSPDTEVGRSADECQHSVSVATFNIGQTEVTQAQWYAVMGSNPSYFRHDNNLPVERVSWNNVQVFIQKLNAQTGKNFRLPTEEEWEYAARGGGSSRMTKYAGSDNLDEVAWCGYEKTGKITHPVATKKKSNELGLYDMSGNVWEWCQDPYGPYPEGCSDQRSIIDFSTDFRVVRGGSWFSSPSDCRAACRFRISSVGRDYSCGLRLAR